MIRTVLGDIPAGALGLCHAHDHVLIGLGPATRANPDLLISDVDRAVEEVQGFAQEGGQALVDAMPIGSGRDPAGLVAVSRRTGVHIIATTGFHLAHYYPPDHWTRTETDEHVLAALCADVTRGMSEGTGRDAERTRIPARAGLVKAAVGAAGLDAAATRALDLAAETHIQTGVPVLTHTHHGGFGLEQVNRLTHHGVPPDAILLSHLDRDHDVDHHRAFADSGAYLVYDGPSRSKYHSTSLVAKLIATAVDAGAADRVLLGMDLALRSYRTSYGGRPGLGWLLREFVPELHATGIDPAQCRAFLQANPARALAMRARRR